MSFQHRIWPSRPEPTRVKVERVCRRMYAVPFTADGKSLDQWLRDCEIAITGMPSFPRPLREHFHEMQNETRAVFHQVLHAGFCTHMSRQQQSESDRNSTNALDSMAAAYGLWLEYAKQAAPEAKWPPIPALAMQPAFGVQALKARNLACVLAHYDDMGREISR